MDWVHCNSCYIQPGEKKGKKFELTSCGHIYCDECVKTSTLEKCKICNSSCTTVELKAEMRADVQQFFDDPRSALKKILSILEFQEGHRQRLTSYRRLTMAKYKCAKEEIYKLRKKIEELEKEISNLKQRCFTPNSGSGNVFPRPSPPSVWSSTPKQPQTPNAKLSLSPVNSDGWVTPNRLTLKRTPSPTSRPLSQPVINCSPNQRKSPMNVTCPNTSQRFHMYPKFNVSTPTTNSNVGNFSSYRGYSPVLGTPKTPVQSDLVRKGVCSRENHNFTPSPRTPCYNMRTGTPISSGSLLSNLKLTSPI